VSSALAKARSPQFGIGVGVALLAFAFAPAFVLDPQHAADLLGALIFLPLAMTSVVFGVAAWIFAAMYKPAPGLVTNVGLIVIGAAWLGSVVACRPPLRSFLPGQRRLVGLLGLLLAWLTLTLLWAQNAEAGWEQLRWWLVAGGLAIVVATSVTKPDHVRLIMFAIVAGAFVEVIMGRGLLIEGRLAGTVGNADDLGNELLPAIVFGVALIADRRDLRQRAVLTVMVLVILRYFVSTESRGALLGLVFVLPVSAVLFHRQLPYLVPATAVVALILGIALGVSGAARHRLLDFGGGGSGRSTLWVVAWRMAETHQPGGIGLNNYQGEAHRYVQRPGALTAVDQIVDQPHVVHNTYLGLLTETGVVGLLLFLAVVGTFLTASFKASRTFEQRGAHDMAWLSRATLLGTVALLCGYFFASNGNDFRLWTILALGPALLIQSRAPLTSSAPASLWPATRFNGDRHQH
jgi:O-antigen ligase